MAGTHDLWLFVVSGFLLNVTPGPDTLYIVGRSTLQGRRAGIVAALGIGGGTLVHILAASKPLALLFLGIVFDINGTLWNLLVAWSASNLSRRVAGRAAFHAWFNRVVGGLFVGVGIKLALSSGR